jgi:hypothetical protein
MLCLAAPACRSDDDSAEAGVGGSREGCGDPGSHSVLVGNHSCACESGYTWCSAALDEFDCCPLDSDETGDDEALGPDAACGPEQLESLICLLDPTAPDDPGATAIWACNGERWVEAPGYSTFACMADGFPFAYGCVPAPTAASEPGFLCGHGPGSPCEVEEYASLCVDEDIIDTCVWGRRTVDRCSRLCASLEAFGPGYAGGECAAPSPDTPATCECCSDC